MFGDPSDSAHAQCAIEQEAERVKAAMETERRD
jgi:hypothetical protein